MQPLIGITSGEIINHLFPWAPQVYGQAFTYTDAVIHSGGIPVIIPLTDDAKVLSELYDRLDGILLAGGNDIDPKLYGQEKIEATVEVSPLRDRTESYLIKRFIDSDKPILAICRGMQMLNVELGGSLYQDLPLNVDTEIDHFSKNVKDYEHLAHSIRIDPNSKLGKIIGRETISVNSNHHQTVNKLGMNLKATAWATDGIIEGLETNDDRFIVAVQAHPESLEYKSEKDWQKLFKAFIEAC